jgi:hypothetical protein
LTLATLASIGLTLASVPASRAQEAKPEDTQTVKAGGLSFEVPTSWKVNQPRSQMRLLEIAIPPVEGDDKPGELVLFAFPGGAGTVQMNVQRWQQQFTTEDGGHPDIKTETIKAGDAEITVVEAAGRYRTQIPTPVDEPNFRLIGGIYTTPQTGYFFKLVGPDKTVQEAGPGFRAMLESMKRSR